MNKMLSFQDIQTSIEVSYFDECKFYYCVQLVRNGISNCIGMVSEKNNGSIHGAFIIAKHGILKKIISTYFAIITLETNGREQKTKELSFYPLKLHFIH